MNIKRGYTERELFISVAVLDIPIVVGILPAAVAWKRRKEGTPRNYEAFCIRGISFLPVGIVLIITTGNRIRRDDRAGSRLHANRPDQS